MDTVACLMRTRGQHTKITVRDLSSKFGVKMNGKQIEQAKDIEVVIKDSQTWAYHDKPHLAGRGYGGYADFIIGENTTFRLERVDISVCSSGMLQQEKLRLIESAVELDINVELKAWIPGISTHLVIGNNKLTEKTFQALVQGAYLVNPLWLEALEMSLKESWESKGTVFNPALETEFPIPPPQALQEASIDWQPNPIKNLSQVVECAGGRWSMEDPNSTMKVISECLSSTMIPVFLIPSGSCPEQFPNVDSVLKRMSYRWVQEEEIGRAVLLVATDMFCNPRYMGDLPSYETLSFMLSSMNQSQSLYVGSLVVPSTVDSSTVEVPHTIQGAKAHVIEDDDDSMSLSLIMLRPKRHTKTGSSAFAAVVETAPSSPKVDNISRPAKKKTKVDRMAAFFDLDDEDDEPMVISPPPKAIPVPTPTTVAPARSASNIDVPVAVSWPEPIDLVSDHEDEVTKQENKKSIETIPYKVPESTEQINLVSDHEDDESLSEKPDDFKKEPHSVVPSEMLSQASQLLKESAASTKKKKKTAYESVREDMIALNLDRKVGRQKENMDEMERGKRLEAQREEAKNKSLTTGLMQSERSDSLLAKHKRRKLIEGPESSQAGSSFVEPSGIKSEASTSLQILDDIKREDWPESWKALPNFKTRPAITPALQEKWKNVPNYKTFRKSVLPGIQKAPGQPKPLALDGEIVIKQEEAMNNIETYIKREERPFSALSKVRPKLSEKQMAKNDIKAMLSDKN
ncbi:hypothetical protein BG000_001860 [Podila horticola]|nr:hypothetical protein BG000_001860 [Podila horticola]